MGRLLILAGLVLVAAGVIVTFAGKLGIGHLPGDLEIKGEHTTLYIPIATCVLLSVLLSLAAWLARRFLG